MSSGRIDAPALSFLFSFFTSETSEADSTSEYYACYGSSYLVGVCVCARVHVSCTRERDIRAYVRVALICAHFTIIVRDRIVVGWRLCPALLRQLFCYSDGVRVFVLNGARAPPFATARYSVFVVGSSRKSNDLKSYAATPTTADSTRGFSSSNATYVSPLLSSIQREWNRRVVSKGKETI